MNNAKKYAKKYLRGVHHASACAGAHCVIHNPSNHHMRSWPLNWRSDRRIFERICQHGIGHPDPDQPGNQIHGCDGCCAPLEDYLTPEAASRIEKQVQSELERKYLYGEHLSGEIERLKRIPKPYRLALPGE